VETGQPQANCAGCAAYKSQQKGHTTADRLPLSVFASGQASTVQDATNHAQPAACSLHRKPHALGSTTPQLVDA
jgi:hypothetical protein